MARSPISICPGCALEMPVDEATVYDGYFNTSPECWSVFAEVLGTEYGNPGIFGQAHQLSVDTYAVQHAGANHPDKSVDIHLAGLYLALERDMAPTSVPRFLQRLANSVETWPHFPLPTNCGCLTIFDVALAGAASDHIDASRRWATSVWSAWSFSHSDVATFVVDNLAMDDTE